MSWWPFLANQWAWLFLLLVPLVIFYFLKLKRPRLEIPSLALWRSVLNDQRVNSPFQRFKRNLLLLLQILMLLCLVLAAMQPIWPSGADRARYLPILVDISASMAAVDETGQSRLDLAKQEVRKLIDNLLPDQRLCLITVSSTARRVTDFTDNQRVLRDALDQLEVSQVASRLEDALRMTQAMARTVSIETAVLYTDGNVPANVDFELPFQLNYQQLPAAGRNIGITALNARRSDTRWDVFARIEGTPRQPGKEEGAVSAAVFLSQNGNELGNELISLEPGQSQRIVFPVEAAGPGTLEVRLKPDGFDALESDNVAFLDLPAGRPLAVFCPVELESFRHALKGFKDVLLYPSDAGESTAASYDLVITDRKADADLEAGTFVFVGILPDDLAKLVHIDDSVAQVIDWQRSTPLLQHVLLTDVQIAERPVSAEGVRDRDYEELAYEILAQGRTGPLILRKDTGGSVSYYLLFHTDRSTLPYRVGFPILVSNAVQIAMQQAGLSEVRGQQTGVLPVRYVKPDAVYDVQSPDGSTAEVRANADGALAGVAAPVVGKYTIREGGNIVASVGVSLLTVSETSLATVEQLQFRELSVGAATAMIKSDRPLWGALAAAGFGLLLAEWWYFQRKPKGAIAR
ncbi:MAG TPA: BatA and WFA domain-containing protein [Planctomycetaceae bacterium]|nr:BatA and WFA domain-containing protein [Planctomycetaceae bacterium]